MLLAAPAFAQANPTFTYGKPEEVKAGAPPPPPVEWKAVAKGGMTLTTGNSQTTNGTLALAISRQESANKFAFDAGTAYGQSNQLVAVLGPDTSADPDPTRWWSTASSAMRSPRPTPGRPRRATTGSSPPTTPATPPAQAAADRIAGKSFAGGGQIGYSRQLYTSDVHLCVSELGYDYSYERYVAQPGRTLDPVSIHSARLFVGETLKISPTSGATASVEALFNLNREAKALDVGSRPPPTQGVAAFHDTRVVGKLGLTTTVLARLSVGFGFTLRYDQNPPPRPIPCGTPAGIRLCARLPAVLGQGRHPGRGDPHLHLHLSRGVGPPGFPAAPS